MALKLGVLMLFASLVPIAALTTMNVLGGMRAILFIGTDGIWEARPPGDGAMYGKAPLYRLLREHHEQPAQTIVNTLLGELTRSAAGPTCPSSTTSLWW